MRWNRFYHERVDDGSSEETVWKVEFRDGVRIAQSLVREPDPSSYKICLKEKICGASVHFLFSCLEGPRS